MIPTRALLRSFAVLVLHAAAREVDRAVGVLLHTTLDLEDFVPRALGLVDLADLARAALVWCVCGLCFWFGLEKLRSRETGERLLAPLLLRPALTLLAIASLLGRSTFPYGSTLVVALTQDWGVAQDALALAGMLALLRPRWPRWSPPWPGEVCFVAFLGYALLVPTWARTWEGHPGNEPKYLRMALAIGHRLSLDVEGIDVPMEDLPVEPISASAPRAVATLAGESFAMLGSLPSSWSTGAIRATRVARQTIRGKAGGIFHVLAPGPSLLLAPTLRLDRALNRARGEPGGLAVTLLVWNALAASLVAALYSLLNHATRMPWLSAAVALFFALVPPFVFYPYQFFPELPGALVMALALRLLLFKPRWSAGDSALLGLLLAGLPWIHQKFLPVWLVLLLMAVHHAVERLVSARAFLALVLPQGVSLFCFALLNFVITGSPRPDALFRAWGPAGITTAHLGQGFLGLLLDQRYGILPYAPIYLLAAGGLILPSQGAARLRRGLFAVGVYYMTVAAADDWHGATSNLGRYFMPIAPFAVACVGVAFASFEERRGAWTLGLALSAWTALVSRLLWLDPHAANEAVRLFAKSAFGDGAVYVPDLFIRSFGAGAPGLFAQLWVWAALAALLTVFVRRGWGASLGRTVAVASLTLVAAGWVLERWPSPFAVARFPNALELRPGTVAFVSGVASIERGRIEAAGGAVEMLVRARTPMDGLAVWAAGDGEATVPGRAAVALSRQGVWLRAPLDVLASLSGRRGVTETLYRQRLVVKGHASLRLALPE